MFLRFEDNIEFATRRFLYLLGIKIDRYTLSDRIQEHPDYPAMLSITDTVSSFGMDTLAVRLEAEQLDQIQIPFLSQLLPDKAGNRHFTVLRPASDHQIDYLDPKTQKWTSFPRSEFMERFSPIALFAEPGQDSAIPAMEKVNKAHLMRQWMKYVLPAALIACFVYSITFQAGTEGFLSALYYLLFGGGTIVGALLLLFEIDRHNPVVQKVCSGGGSGKANCDAVLDSRGSRFLGLSWSQLGFTYFLGGLLLLTMSIIGTTHYRHLLALLSLAALPYIIYSIYYQWRVVRQWCRLCLMVQGILLAQGILVLSTGWAVEAWSSLQADGAIAAVTVFGIIYILSDRLIRSGQDAKEGKKHHQAFKRVKSNLRIFESLLMRERSCTPPKTGLGITIGDPNATHTIIKVCNPYCGPCAKAHPDIENLVRQNKDVQVRIIFTATGDDDDRRTPPVQHLLAIAGQGDPEKTRNALNGWYMAKEKDYDAFAAKYPIEDEPGDLLPAIREMDAWCHRNEIRHTPTYFVNGHELPALYSIKDLDYLLRI